MDIGILSVSQINFYIKSMIDGDQRLRSLLISGELSNFTRHYKSGHLYFSLKDDRAAIKCVMFSSSAARLRFEPSDGMRVIIRGGISVYEPSGQYQLYAEDMQPDGAGALYVAFEQLKGRLEEEGLFSAEHKKQLPRYPKKIGVVTSPTGAARRDIENIISRRYPCAEIILYPATVQGESAPGQLAGGVEYLDKNGLADVIIIGRGGGSAEDLSAFNDESLARAVFACATPIISAVGHETDYTICDFVSDMRAPTPSAAAELAVPDRQELLAVLKQKSQYMAQLALSNVESGFEKIDELKRGILFSPEGYIADKALDIDNRAQRFKTATERYIEKKEELIKYAAAALSHLSPLGILSRGYAMPLKDGKTVKTVADVKIGDKMKIILQDGSIDCKAEEING